MLFKSFQKKSLFSVLNLAITVSLLSVLTNSLPSVAKTSIDSEIYSNQTEVLLTRLPRPVPGWISRIPSRSFGNWIDEALSAGDVSPYQLRPSSVEGSVDKMKVKRPVGRIPTP